MKTLTKRNVSSQKMSALQPMKSAANKSGSRSGSVYSPVIASLRVLAWKTESVYDADYRVLHIRNRYSWKDEDWGFEDEDDKE